MILSIIEIAQRLGFSTAKILRQVCEEGLHKGMVSMQLPLDNALPAPK